MEPNQNPIVDPLQPQAPVPQAPIQSGPQHTPPTPHETKKPSKLKWTYLLIFFLILIIVALLGVLYISQTKNSAGPTPTPAPKAAACTMEAKLCPDGVTSVGRQGPNCEFATCPTKSASPSSVFILDKTYSSPDKWQIDYPGKFKLETRESSQMGPNGIGTPIVISYVGPTQSSGTEFHDGVSFSIGILKKPANQSIKDALDEYTKPDPDLSTRTDLKQITVNSLSGYETTVTGLGSFRTIFLNYPGANDKVYAMSIFAGGPPPSNADYKAVIEKMIESFRNI